MFSLTPYFICLRHCSRFTRLTITRQVNTCIFQSRNGYLPAGGIRRENVKILSGETRGLPAHTLPEIQLKMYFHTVIQRQTTQNPSPGTDAPSVSLHSVPMWLYCRWHCRQSGGRPHEKSAHAIGACVPAPLIRLANAAVSHTSAREPESPVGSGYLSPHLTFDINSLPIFELQTDRSPCVWS